MTNTEKLFWLISLIYLISTSLARDYKCSYERDEICVFRGVQLKSPDQIVAASFSADGKSPRNIKFEQSSIGSLSSEMFQPLPNVEYFDASSSGLKAIPKGAFATANKIRVIILKGNKLQQLENNLFEGATKITSFDSSQNSINEIKENAFSGLSQLTVLKLDNNQITNLPQGVFTPLTSLESIDLQYNGLSKIDDSLFESCTSLISLNVSHNELQKFELKQFQREWSVDSIDISFNRLKTVNVPNNLRKLVASNNQLQLVQVLGKDPQLIFLRLSHNKLTSMDQIPSFNKLVTLDLGYNEIETVDFSSITKFKNLIKLKLDGNRLSTLSNSLTTPWTYLKYVNLSHNQMTKLKLNVLKTLPRIITLDLSYNKLTELQAKNISDNFPVMVRLGIEGNDFKCDNIAGLVKDLKYAMAEHKVTVDQCKRGQRLMSGICCS